MELQPVWNSFKGRLGIPGGGEAALHLSWGDHPARPCLRTRSCGCLPCVPQASRPTPVPPPCSVTWKGSEPNHW